MKRCKRKKKFLGAIISGVVGLAGGIGSAIMSSNANKKATDKQEQLQREMFNKQQALQNRADTINYARNLTDLYGNQEYVNEFRKKVTLKYGGCMNDRIKMNKRFKCGGRKKAALGINWSDVAQSTLNSIGTLASAGIAANAMNYATNKQKNYIVEGSNVGVGVTNGDKHGAKVGLKRPSYYVDGAEYQDRMAQLDRFKCGGKKKKK